MQRHIASAYYVSKQRFGFIIDQVCTAIIEEMGDQIPQMSKEQWLDISNTYNAKWNFPNCLGSIDGKHIPIKCPKNAGSLFFNYKVYMHIHITTDTESVYHKKSNYRLLYLFTEIPQHRSNGGGGR